MESQFRVKRILCHAQYGDILLCDVASGSMTTTTSSSAAAVADTNKPVVASTNATHDRTLAVIKQISWTRVQAKLQQMDAAMQPSDDPMVEIDVAAKICAAGNHKNVVQYHHVLRGDRGSFGIVMEYCNEGDLLKRLDHLPDHRLCESEALLVLHQIVDGLRFLHNDVGVAHRDVSLENVMVHDGICKLGDFGLSTRIHDDNDTDRRRRRLVLGRVGKLSYMAPEVAAGDPYDPALADIWSLGILFFILLTGSPLVEMASTDCPAFRAFCRLGLQRVLEDWKMVDMFHADTISLCDRMLQVDPHNRITLDRIAAHPAFDRLPTDRP